MYQRRQQAIEVYSQLFKWQAVLLLVMSVVVALLSTQQTVLAVVCGGLLAILPQGAWVYCYFAKLGIKHMKRTMLVFGLGEVLKLIVTMLGFMTCVKWLHVPVGPMVLSFILMVFLFTVGPLFCKGREGKR